MNKAMPLKKSYWPDTYKFGKNWAIHFYIGKELLESRRGVWVNKPTAWAKRRAAALQKEYESEVTFTIHKVE